MGELIANEDAGEDAVDALSPLSTFLLIPILHSAVPVHDARHPFSSLDVLRSA
jgi:hypothetical protein